MASGWHLHHSRQHKQGDLAARHFVCPLNTEHQQRSLYLWWTDECVFAHISLPPLNYNKLMP